MHLSDLWFIAIAVLWAGYFVLEGFDFGVGILLPILGRDQTRRRIMINTIGPTWDGNEVWLLTAGGATFAAFPGWYASMFSAFYLPLLLIRCCPADPCCCSTSPPRALTPRPRNRCSTRCARRPRPAGSC
jgi:cytochrome d oxidase subunit CydB